MRDTFTSINDPIFFVHHAGLDRIWALWQEMDTSRRLHDAGPPDYETESVPLSMNSMLWMGIFSRDRKAFEVFDTLNRDGRGILCYKYEGLPASAYGAHLVN
jgi:tyrosinase